MRTLKKTLCLVLALVMCLGLCTVAVADNSVDNLSKFTDIANVDHVEAADFLIAAGVVDGFKVGNGFQLKPDNTLTRAEAVKLVTYILLGAEKADAYKATEIPFTDVKKGHWAEGYIQYAYNEGIIQGRNPTTFDPEGQVTGLEMAAMLLRSLGYDRTPETALKYPVGIQAKAFSLGLFNGGITSAATDTPVNRDKTFQMVFNAMTQIATVQYNKSVGAYFVGDTFYADQLFCVGDANDSDEWWVTPAGGYVNTLGWKTANMKPNPTDDALGYAMREWMNRKSGNVVTNEYPDYTPVETVTAKSNVKALSKKIEASATIGSNDSNEFEIWVNGGDTSSTPADPTATADGTTTNEKVADIAGFAVMAAKQGYTVELIDTNDNGAADRLIVVIEHIAKVGTVTAAKGDDPKKAALDVYYNNSNTTTPVTIAASNVTADDLAIVKTLEKGDIVKVVPTYASCSVTLRSDPDSAGMTGVVPADATPISIETIDPVVSAITSYEGTTSVSNPNSQSVTYGGATYNYSAVAPMTASAPFISRTDYQFKGSTYDFYFNDAGYLIGVTAHHVEDTIPNVLYVTQMESKKTNDSLFDGIEGYAARIRAYDVKGNEKVYNLKLETAKGDEPAANYLLTTAGLIEASKLADTDVNPTAVRALTLAKGEQYIKIDNVTKTGESSAAAITIKLTNMGTWAADWALNTTDDDGTDFFSPVLAFTEDDDGYLTLSGLPKTLNNGVTYDGGVVKVVDDKVKVQKDNAKVLVGADVSSEANATDVLYATVNTNLVIVNDKGVVTTTTGYNNFPAGPGNPPAAVTITAKANPSAGNDAKAVFYVTTQTANDPKKVVTDIVVIGYVDPTPPPAAEQVLLYSTGDWKDVEGKVTEETLWKFMNAATGEYVWYQLKSDCAQFTGTPKVADPDTVYIGTVEADVFNATSKPTMQEVVQTESTWIRVAPNADGLQNNDAYTVGTDSTLYYLNGVTPLEFNGDPAPALRARVSSTENGGGSAIPGSMVYVLADGNNKLTALFVKTA